MTVHSVRPAATRSPTGSGPSAAASTAAVVPRTAKRRATARQKWLQPTRAAALLLLLRLRVRPRPTKLPDLWLVAVVVVIVV